MPDKTIYVGLFQQPPRNTEGTTATFALNVATGTNAGWPHDSVIVTSLDGGEPETRYPSGHTQEVYQYEGLEVGEHRWHASVTGTDIYEKDADPGFPVVWSIVEA